VWTSFLSSQKNNKKYWIHLDTRRQLFASYYSSVFMSEALTGTEQKLIKFSSLN
jgi:hypothetical protein